jgi:hypothetical protein
MIAESIHQQAVVTNEETSQPVTASEEQVLSGKRTAKKRRLPSRFVVYAPPEAESGYIIVKKRWLYMPKKVAVKNYIENAKFIEIGYDIKNSEFGILFHNEKPTDPQSHPLKIRYLRTNPGTEVTKSDKDKYCYSIDLDGIIKQHKLKFARGTTIFQLIKSNEIDMFFTIDISVPIRTIFTLTKDERIQSFSEKIAAHERKIQQHKEQIAKLTATGNIKYQTRIERFTKVVQFWEARVIELENKRRQYEEKIALRAEKKAQKEKARLSTKKQDVTIPTAPLQEARGTI